MGCVVQYIGVLIMDLNLYINDLIDHSTSSTHGVMFIMIK
jgi:hypothetical protein